MLLCDWRGRLHPGHRRVRDVGLRSADKEAVLREQQRQTLPNLRVHGAGQVGMTVRLE